MLCNSAALLEASTDLCMLIPDKHTEYSGLNYCSLSFGIRQNVTSNCMKKLDLALPCSLTLIRTL